LYNADMADRMEPVRRLFQRIHHLNVRHRRILNGRVLPSGSFHADCSACDHQITALYIQLHPAAGSYPDKGSCPASVQLFHSDGCRRPADSGGSHAHLHSIQTTGISHKLTAVCNKLRVVQKLCDQLTAFGVARQQDILSYILWFRLNMILYSRAFRIINHSRSSSADKKENKDTTLISLFPSITPVVPEAGCQSSS
jgi:hypothetical protein